MSDLLEKGISGLLESLADLFETRALIAARQSTVLLAKLNVGEARGRRSAYEEAARDTRKLAERLRE
jgi:hypothetical protein